MIWMVITKKEMEDGASHVFRFNREAFGKENITLKVVDEDDALNFIGKDDVVISRTMNERLLSTIASKGVNSTAENYKAYMTVKDKCMLFDLLHSNGISVPMQYKSQSDLVEGKTYFVKPRYGSDSFGITRRCICKSLYDVARQVVEFNHVYEMEPIIEDFIAGPEYTVTCARCKGNGCDYIMKYPIGIECEETGGIQTRECKVGFKEYCYSEVTNSDLKVIAEKVFNLLGLKHLARIDFRRDQNGKYYVIDVNLLPGLGPLDHYAKSLLLTYNISYIGAMLKLVDCAS